jgi:hypothetical protein
MPKPTARQDLYAVLMSKGPHSPQRSEWCTGLIEAFRAEVIREAADAIAAQDPLTAPLVGVHARGEAVALLRRMADEAGTPR